MANCSFDAAEISAACAASSASCSADKLDARVVVERVELARFRLLVLRFGRGGDLLALAQRVEQIRSPPFCSDASFGSSRLNSSSIGVRDHEVQDRAACRTAP